MSFVWFGGFDYSADRMDALIKMDSPPILAPCSASDSASNIGSMKADVPNRAKSPIVTADNKSITTAAIPAQKGDFFSNVLPGRIKSSRSLESIFSCSEQNKEILSTT